MENTPTNGTDLLDKFDLNALIEQTRPLHPWLLALLAVWVLWLLADHIQAALGRLFVTPIVKYREGKPRRYKNPEWYKGVNDNLDENETPVPKYRYTPKQPSDLLDDKARLIVHNTVRSTLAPQSIRGTWIQERETYTHEVKDKEGNVIRTEERRKDYPEDFHAWRSAYPYAVEAFISRKPPYNSNTQRYQPRLEVQHIASQIAIREATSGEAAGLIIPEGTNRGIFIIELNCQESDPETIRSLEPAIQSALALEKLEEIKAYPDRIIYRARRKGVKGVLDNAVSALEFLAEHKPSADLKHIPMAPTSTGSTWSIPPMHTLAAGISGSGKSSPINMLLAQMAPYVAEGRCRIVAIDPKSDGDISKDWAGTPIVEKCGVNADEYIRIIEEFHESMRSRGNAPITAWTQETFKEKHTQSGFVASQKTPLRYLVIDELTELEQALSQHPQGSEAIKKLDAILRLGRSSGHIVFAATQSPNRDALGALARVRSNFAITIALKLGTENENNFMLGLNAAAKGYDSTAIPQNQKGMAWVKNGDTGEFQLIRFPYFTDEERDAFIYPYLPQSTAELTTSTAGGVQLPVTLEDTSDTDTADTATTAATLDGLTLEDTSLSE